MILKPLFTLIIMLVSSTLVASSIDSAINELLTPVSHFIAGIVFYSISISSVDIPLIVIWLVSAGSIFTFYLGFINIRGFSHSIRLVKGHYEDPDDVGEITHFQTLSTALSATVGLGNIAGVAIAISIGGPGATFWMILAGVVGMSSKFLECALGVKYRVINHDGTVSGGPMYYLSCGLKELGYEKLGRVLAVFFAICCIGGSFGGGNMFQANQAYQQVVSVTGGDISYFADKGWLFGLILSFLVACVIIGGLNSIAKVTSKIVPFMGIVYCLSCLVVITMNYSQIPSAFIAIFQGAFYPEGIAGGFLGVLIQGFRRAAFSNEAGIGSSSIAHSAATTKEPISEGFVALLEPFIDTIVICTMTALVIVITGTYKNELGLSGVQLTSSAFESAFSWFPYVLAISVLLFAFSTMISWSYYGAKAWSYLFGYSIKSDVSYKLFFCFFIVIGCSMSLDPIIDISDAMIFAMSFANIIGLFLLAPRIRWDLKDYMNRLKGGEIKDFQEKRTARLRSTMDFD
ncbi:alanine/glycine:cation symporter family protein [Marinomonas sp. 15G1-11]|uniref:Alanine/glycine:cation symporter family protein n=1 Tax=Marinomonas phaeophyticola TaxID=3004091 RepID=A0ABT4JSA0_9GAMM|nr:alanine/glycine:cation symporter family protein [Marinomonas sp. 15G1-11]MCZ2720693.1 alanine/glycine:cation symporter family protein [Marinomonas sp. 15G1-11]